MMGIEHADDSNFSEVVEKSDKPCVLDFWAEWCMPCKMFGPIFEEVSKEFEGKVKFVKIDTEKAPNTANRFQIMSIPSVVFYKDGKEVDRATGMQSNDRLKELVQEKLL